jgi:hypothetical protein
MKLTYILPLLGLLSAPVIAQNTIFSDNFTSGSRTQWVASTGTSLTVVNDATFGSNVLQLTTQANAVATFSGTFSISAAAPITLTVNFRDVTNNGTLFAGVRIGLFNNNGTSAGAADGSAVTTNTGNDSGIWAALKATNMNMNSESGAAAPIFFGGDRLGSTSSTYTLGNVGYTDYGTSVHTLQIVYTTSGANTLATTTLDGLLVNSQTIASTTFGSVNQLAFTTDQGSSTLQIDNVLVTQAIPEPATYAAMLGAIALGSSVYRRRRSHA